MLEGATTSVVGITSLQMGVFGGIIVGLGVSSLHNRFYKIELPQVLSFFGGTRFVPIISSLVYTGVGILMFFIWPVIPRQGSTHLEILYLIQAMQEHGYMVSSKTITSIRSSSRILPSITADCTWWNNGSRRHSHRRCTEHFLCTAR